MTESFTDEDLARILAYCEAWCEVFHGRIDERWGGFDFQAAALGDLPALVAEVRELQDWQRRKDYDLFCGDCGGPHFLDCSLPSDLWNQIGRPEEVLCPVCIDRRLQAAGLTAEAEFYYAGKGLQSKLYTKSQGEIEMLQRAVCELREALADALAELMDAIPFGAGLDLEAAGVAPRRANVIRRVGRIVKEASDGHV